MANKGPAGGSLFDQRLVDCSHIIKVHVVSLVVRLMAPHREAPLAPKDYKHVKFLYFVEASRSVQLFDTLFVQDATPEAILIRQIEMASFNSSLLSAAFRFRCSAG